MSLGADAGGGKFSTDAPSLCPLCGGLPVLIVPIAPSRRLLVIGSRLGVWLLHAASLIVGYALSEVVRRLMMRDG
jgi:hypothetical protein